MSFRFGLKARHRPRPSDAPAPTGRSAKPAAGLGVVLTALVVAIAVPQAQATAAADSVGAWQLVPYQTDIIPIHAAVLPTGKLLLMAGSETTESNFLSGNFRSELWDYTKNSLTPVTPPWDVFCSGHVFLPDGRLLITGGTQDYPTADGWYVGSKQTYFFDPSSEQYTRGPDMAGGRWYPTLVARGDGSVYAAGGLSDVRNQDNRVPEVFTPGAGWRSLPPASSQWPLYPHLLLSRTGTLFYTGGNVFGSPIPPGMIDVAQTTLTPVPNLSDADHRDQSASVLLPPAQDQRVLVIGGGNNRDPATNHVDLIDLKVASPTYQPAAPMAYPRMHVSAVLLPDRTVLATGGGRSENQDAVLPAEIYDPVANVWRTVASSSVPRFYHSTAVLLPDGRVVTMGSQPGDGSRETRIEIYSPPYLFKGSRPVITSNPATMSYGGSYSLQLSTAAKNIKYVSLMRPMATTHSTDTEQRLVDLPVSGTRSGSSLRVTVPTNQNLAPPGNYMLTVVDKNGIPSVAKWVHLG